MVIDAGAITDNGGHASMDWDLRAHAPTATSYSYPISAVPHRTPLVPQGPLVAPGKYTVRLTVDGKSETASLLVKMDPRVHMSQTELESLYKTQVSMAATLDALARADLQAHSVMQQIAGVEDSQLKSQLSGFNTALKLVLDGAGTGGGKSVAGLDQATAEAAQLYGEVEQADANPTTTLLDAAAHAQMESKDVFDRWEGFKRKELPSANEELRKAHHPGINLEEKPNHMPGAGDED